MKRGTFGHPKTEDLANRLGISFSWAGGIVGALWEWAAEYTPAGNVGKYSNSTLAKKAGFPVERADELVDALAEIRWLDRHEQHRFIIHDWPTHCEDSIHARLARAGQCFADGTEPKLTKIPAKERKALRALLAKNKGVIENGGINPPKSADGRKAEENGSLSPSPSPPPSSSPPPPSPPARPALDQSPPPTATRLVAACDLISDFYRRWVGPDFKQPNATREEIDLAAEVVDECGIDWAKTLQRDVVEAMRKSFPAAERFKASEVAWRKKIAAVRKESNRSDQSRRERERKDTDRAAHEARQAAEIEQARPKWNALSQPDRDRFLQTLPAPIRGSEEVVVLAFASQLEGG